MRIREPRTTALIFSSGKMVCTGAKRSEYSSFTDLSYSKFIKSQIFKVVLSLQWMLSLPWFSLFFNILEYTILLVLYLLSSIFLFSCHLRHLSSEEQSRLAARKYARVVQKLGFPAKFLDFKIQNMVGSCDVKFPIRLEGLVLTHQQFSR